MRKFTRVEFYGIIRKLGLDSIKAELIDGMIVEKQPEDKRHFATLEALREDLLEVFGREFWVRCQATLDLSDMSVVDPDVAVVPGAWKDWGEDNPTTALLVVEVSDRTLHYDRTGRASLYAANGIQDYWIVNVQDRQLEIRRNPLPDGARDFGFGYASLTTLKPGETATPLATPKRTVRVDKMFF